MKILPRVALVVAALLLFSSCSETGSSQTSKSGGTAVQQVAKAKPAPKLKLSRKQSAAAEAKALSDARSPRQCKTPKQTCGYGAGPAGEQCSCWSTTGAPDVGLTIK